MAARPVFKLFGMIGMKGLENVKKDLKEVDTMAKKLEKSLNKTGRNITKMGGNLSKKLTAPIVGLAGSLTLLSKQTGDYADKLLDLEQVTGLTLENLQKFELIAREAGVSFEGLVGVIGKFQKRLPGIIEGKGRAAEAMRTLGVSAKDANGNLKDINVLFPELLKALNGVEDITMRNVTAQQLFGKSMSDLAPVLSLSAKDLERIGKEAEDMGIILDRDAINAANNFRVSLEKLQAQFTGVFRVIATKFIPILNDTVMPLIKDTVIPVILQFGEAVGTVLNWFNSLSPEAKKIGVILTGIAVALGPAIMLFGKFVISLKALIPLLVLAKKGMLLLSAAMAANPIGAVIVLVMGLVAAMGLLGDENSDLKKSFQDTWDGISGFLEIKIAEMRKSLFEFLRDTLRVVEGISGIIPGVGAKVKKARRSLLGMIREERVLISQKKRAREEAKLQEKATDELREAVDKAKKSVNEMVKAQQKSIDVSLKDIETKEEQANITAKLADDRAMFEDQWTQKLSESILNRKQLLEVERQNALMEADRLGADRNDIELFYSIERLRIAEEEEREKQRLEEETAKKRSEQAQFARDLTISAIGQTFAVISQFYGMQIEKIEQKKKADIDAVNASLMSEEEKAAAVGQIEEDSAKKIKELRRKQAIADKAQALFGIAINTANAILMAFATLGPVGGAIAAGVIGSLGAAQAAIVAAKPIPFAEGGLVKRTPGGVNAIIGEGREDEVVFPLKTGVEQMADSLFSRVREMNLNGLGVPELAGVGAPATENHWHIGTLVADDQGIKELERRQRKFRTEEDQRRGMIQ